MENISFPDQWLTIAAERMRGLPQPVLGPSNLPDIHIASSLLQKALRRSHGPNAHRAARYMLNVDPSRLWRRIVVIAFEDFGPAHPDVLAIVCAISSNAKWRRQNGGDRKAVAFAIDLLLGTVRDRLVDDCYMVAIGLADGYCPAEYASEIVQPILREATKAVQTCELHDHLGQGEWRLESAHRHRYDRSQALTFSPAVTCPRASLPRC
jgi:hypothetical protein